MLLVDTTRVGKLGIGQHGRKTDRVDAEVLVLLVFLVATRRWADAKLLVFATPLSAAALLMYSDRGMTSYSSFHVFGFAIFASLAADGLARWLFRRTPAATPNAS